ncbi:cdc2-related protein kinase 1 [Plasmodium cynomolgi strain B]|uniref:Cyclin-dependent kinase 2 homolog n=1 Tax=Plasmodium cynomolgi (strain B) TaxID=1120755 RepID=K6UIT4_PLACD|nr:cdc2-related protein kinase 1 [Plasmodium cynomolgi strain B]GAB65303.1 cdc2-related protein kinase 1 [Plasmodium cynomolgi strain B]
MGDRGPPKGGKYHHHGGRGSGRHNRDDWHNGHDRHEHDRHDHNRHDHNRHDHNRHDHNRHDHNRRDQEGNRHFYWGDEPPNGEDNPVETRYSSEMAKRNEKKKDQFEKSRYHYYNRRADENSYFGESQHVAKTSDKRKHSPERTSDHSYRTGKRIREGTNQGEEEGESSRNNNNVKSFKTEREPNLHEKRSSDEGGRRRERMKRGSSHERHLQQCKDNVGGKDEGEGWDECESEEFGSDIQGSDEGRSDGGRSDGELSAGERSAGERSDGPPSDGEAIKAQGLLNGCRSVKNYRRLNKISEGTYGAVFRAQNKKTKKIVALKQLKHFSSMRHEGFAITSLREINILLQLYHENILSVKEVVIGKHLNDIYLVMEYVEHELKMLLDNKTPSFTISELKCLLKQLLSGVDYLHTNWVMHRDLKTTNLLYSNKGVLKICDFGMARKFGHINNHNITKNVVTLWYRAPELLLGERCYTNKIDIWSVGCIFAEMILKKPLFIGENEIDQILKILSLLGLPDREDYPEFYEYSFISKNKELFKKKKIKMNVTKIRSHFPNVANQFSGLYLSDTGLDLLQQLLHFNPKNRISAADALKHPYFKEFPKPLDVGDMPIIPDTNKVIRSRKMTSQYKLIGQNNIRFHS